ncbi:hypothetical protein M408DRAFT_311472 [Serendipita vermifera MAFF 305830]|uniref:F-box domain-containing protein n=1 Tax=Serendipita vermifera MAFF 305830 TaxID=933852 RepID=A0A0C3B707_SERVB|nr:hypothetical protein M408DRAFT_311472 [Serendipita vermifera MAFF 305830]
MAETSIGTNALDSDPIATSETSQAVKDELFKAGTKQLETESNNAIEEIQKAAKARKDDLERQISLLKEFEAADIAVCKLYLKRNIQELREAIYGETTIAGPIRKLPAEMLSEVFRYHVESNRSPWILVKVSKYWMGTAMATPQLWRHILVDDYPTPAYHRYERYIVNGKKEFTTGNKQVCPNPAELQAAITRSGVVPLNVEISRLQWSSDPSKSDMLSQLLCSPVSVRIMHLDAPTHDLANMNPDDQPFGPFTALESLRLWGTIDSCADRLLDVMSLTCKRLRLIRIPELPLSKLKTFSFWHSLTTIDGSHYGREKLNAISDQLINLKQLLPAPWGWPNETTPQSTLKNIRSLSLSCSILYLSHLELPRLETLIFTEIGRNPTISPDRGARLHFPMLAELNIEPKNSMWPQYIVGAFPMVADLTVKCKDLTDETIVAVLETVPSVQNILLPGSARPDFGIRILSELGVRKSLCPNLKTLELGVSGEPIRTLKTHAGPVVKRLVKVRKQVEQPIHRLTIHWKRRTEIISQDPPAPTSNGETKIT